MHTSLQTRYGSTSNVLKTGGCERSNSAVPFICGIFAFSGGSWVLTTLADGWEIFCARASHAPFCQLVHFYLNNLKWLAHRLTFTLLVLCWQALTPEGRTWPVSLRSWWFLDEFDMLFHKVDQLMVVTVFGCLLVIIKCFWLFWYGS